MCISPKSTDHAEEAEQVCNQSVKETIEIKTSGSGLEYKATMNRKYTGKAKWTTDVDTLGMLGALNLQ